MCRSPKEALSLKIHVPLISVLKWYIGCRAWDDAGTMAEEILVIQITGQLDPVLVEKEEKK